MDSRDRRLIWLLAALALGRVWGTDARPSPPAGDQTPGYCDLGVSARTFEAPLFGNDALTTYHLFGNQRFPDAGSYSVWLNGGFPGYTAQYGIEGDEIPVAGRLARVNAGDFALGPLLPDALSAGADTFPVDGGRLRLHDDRSTWSVFGGTAKYDLDVRGRPRTRPGLYGAEYLGQRDGDYYGAGVTLVEQAARGDSEKDGTRDIVVSGRYIRGVSPWAHLFGEALSAGGRDLGFRAGVQWRFQNGSLTSSIYSFGAGFPYVFPLYRPGERGVDLRGRYEPSEFSTVYGNVYYASDPTILHRSDLRGSLGFGLRFGSNRPVLSLDYSHADLAYDSLVAPRSGLLVDRYAVSVGRDSSSGFLNVRLEHDRSARVAGPDRTQALFSYRAVLGTSSLLDGSAVAQRDGSGDFGLTAESTVERPLRGRLDYLVGVGGAYVDRGKARSGEGMGRLGLSLRLMGSGWYARAELRLPFAIGLDRSELNRRIVSLDVGNRLAWKQARPPLPSSGPHVGRTETGTIEGAVLREGTGQAGVAVLLDGEPVGVTRSDGSFRIRRVSAGRRQVALDIRALDPRYGVAGGSSREVDVAPQRLTRVDFEVAAFSSFQGALVACSGEGMVPIRGARLTLSDGVTSRTAHTSNIGGFQFGEVPPGAYEMEIDPGSVDPGIPLEDLPRFRVDLTGDCLGRVVKIRCPVEPEAAADQRPACVRRS